MAEVAGETIHFLEIGRGTPVVFLHGNPTSSELWRGVISHLASACRCIAPDLIGMGRSSKPAIAYAFVDHARFLETFLEVTDLDEVVFVGHDWGVALALDVLARHPQRVRGIALMEGRVRPLPDWLSFDSGGRELFKQFRSEPDGTRLVIEDNILIETILQAGTMRRLTQAELDVFREPYLDPKARQPLLQWTREIPIGNEPAVTATRMERGYNALQSSTIPKLALVAQPGAVIGIAEIERWQRDVPDMAVVDIGAGTHFVPLDRPTEIASALEQWLRAHALI